MESLYLSVRSSVCHAVRVSGFVRTISPEPLNLLTNLGVVVYYHEMECHAEKLINYLQWQGQSEGLHGQNISVSLLSSNP